MKTKKLLLIYSIVLILIILFATAFTSNIESWAIDMSLVILLVIGLLITRKFFEFSKTSYSLIFIYFLLTVIGTFHGNAYSPIGFWIQEIFGFARNPYDRIVHFLFGIVWYFPIYEIFKGTSKIKNKFWLFFVPWAIVVGAAGMYEIIEWVGATIISHKEAGIFLG